MDNGKGWKSLRIILVILGLFEGVVVGGYMLRLTQNSVNPIIAVLHFSGSAFLIGLGANKEVWEDN